MENIQNKFKKKIQISKQKEQEDREKQLKLRELNRKKRLLEKKKKQDEHLDELFDYGLAGKKNDSKSK